MIRSIINAVCAKLAESFKDAEIYDESVTQGLEEPCFFVRVISPQLTKELAGRYRLDCPVIVQYYPKRDGEENKSVIEASERIFTVLEDIEVNGRIFHGNISVEYPDDFLSATATYECLLYSEGEAAEAMEELNIKI